MNWRFSKQDWRDLAMASALLAIIYLLMLHAD